MVLERRLPYQVQTRWDRIATRVGWRNKVVCVGALAIRVRRLTCDEVFVANVIEKGEYTHDGFGINPGDTVVDVGANIGTFAVLASTRAARVLAIEPDSENYRRLRENIALNSAANILPIRAAVAKEAGTIVLQRAREGGYHSTTAGMMGESPVAQETVEARTLSEIFREHEVRRCHFLKLDCEGAEYDILLTLPAVDFSRIDKVAMEWHGVEDRERRWLQVSALAECLIDHGFRLETYLEYEHFRCGMIRAVNEHRAGSP